MQGVGYEIKSSKHYTFKGAEQKKFIRLRSLGDGYSEDEIKAIIEGKALQRVVYDNWYRLLDYMEKRTGLPRCRAK